MLITFKNAILKNKSIVLVVCFALMLCAYAVAQNVPIHINQGATKLTVESGAEIEIQSGGTLDVQAGATFAPSVLTLTNIDAGASGTAGSVDVFPTTAAKGKLTLSATDNTGDTAVTITNAAHGQATSVTIPDSGLATSYVLQSTAAVTVAEADVLDGATAGTAVASKAVVVDSNKDVSAIGYVRPVTETVAATGTVQGDAAAITGPVAQVTGATNTAGVILPAAEAGKTVTLLLDDLDGLKVYPASGDIINNLAANASVTIYGKACVDFTSYDGTTWYSNLGGQNIPLSSVAGYDLSGTGLMVYGGFGANVVRGYTESLTIGGAAASHALAQEVGTDNSGWMTLVRVRIQTTVTATTATKIGIGDAADPDRWGLTADLLDNTLITTVYPSTIIPDATIALYACDNSGNAAGTLDAGVVEVDFIYLDPVDIANL